MAINIITPFSLKTSLPLDERSVVSNYAALLARINFYKGEIVYVEDLDKYYCNKGSSSVADWVEFKTSNELNVDNYILSYNPLTNTLTHNENEEITHISLNEKDKIYLTENEINTHKEKTDAHGLIPVLPSNWGEVINDRPYKISSGRLYPSPNMPYFDANKSNIIIVNELPIDISFVDSSWSHSVTVPRNGYVEISTAETFSGSGEFLISVHEKSSLIRLDELAEIPNSTILGNVSGGLDTPKALTIQEINDLLGNSGQTQEVNLSYNPDTRTIGNSAGTGVQLPLAENYRAGLLTSDERDKINRFDYSRSIPILGESGLNENAVAIGGYVDSCDAVFFDYIIKRGFSSRAGTIIASYNGSNVSFSSVSTVDSGDTSPINIWADIYFGVIYLYASSTQTGWTISVFSRNL